MIKRTESRKVHISCHVGVEHVVVDHSERLLLLSLLRTIRIGWKNERHLEERGERIAMGNGSDFLNFVS